MRTTYKGVTIGAFLEELSSDTPAPGGGSVAALSGALAASLVSMVCNLTIGKEKFSKGEQELKIVLEKAIELREELTRAVEEDIEAYQQVIACYRLPKGTAEEKAARKEQIQAALKHANEVPYQIADACYRILELNRRLPQLGNPNAISDVAVSVHLAEAALQSALYNVAINCSLIADKGYATEYRSRRVDLAARAISLQREIAGKVAAMLED